MTEGLELTTGIVAAPAIIAILVWAARRALKLKSNLLPMIAILIGVFVSILFVILQAESMSWRIALMAILEGIVVGAAACGYYDVRKIFKKKK